MPSSVACRQNPASPTLSSATLSHCDSTNTCADHSGELAAITAAATTPTIAATRIGCVRGPVDDLGVARPTRTSRVASCSSPNAAPVTRPERAPEHAEHREARRLEVARGQVQHRVPAQRGQHGRRADPGHAARVIGPVG